MMCGKGGIDRWTEEKMNITESCHTAARGKHTNRRDREKATDYDPGQSLRIQ